MKKHLFSIATVLLAVSLVGCGSKSSASNQSKEESSLPSSTEQGPKKTVTVNSISLNTESNKAYITVSGKQENYTADEFKWAWGLKNEAGEFKDGKEKPTGDDFTKVTFTASKTFTVKYCLSDITTIKSGELYRIYGGTPESYDDIPFASNNFGANDGTRKFYLRSDKDNSLVYDCIQPMTFNNASIVNVAQEDLPAGVTTAGAYLKFGGTNSKNLTQADLDARHTNNKIAGNFQRVIGEYDVHDHADEERFYKIEGNDIFFYCYIGFIKASEGWMTHFDMVEGNSGANLQFDTTINGVQYVVNGATYKVYADNTKSGAENYWGCLGVLREA